MLIGTISARTSAAARRPAARRRPAFDMISASSSRTVATCCCCSAVSTSLDSASEVNAIDERREHDRAGEGEAEREAERARGGVDAGGLADPLVGDRRERVVVELRDEQAEPAAGDDERDREVPARRGRGRRRRRSGRAPRRARNPIRIRPTGRPRPAARPRWRRRTCSATAGRSRGRRAARCSSSTICRYIGSTIIVPPSAICCSS